MLLVIYTIACMAAGSTAAENVTSVWGHAVRERSYQDNTASIVIPEPHNPLRITGHISRVSCYYGTSERFNTFLHIYRREGPLTFKIISSTTLAMNTTVGNKSRNIELNVKRGDLVGLYGFDRIQVPYDGTECWTQRAFYKDMQVKKESQGPGRNINFSVMSSGTKPCRNYSLSLQIEPEWIHGDNATRRLQMDRWTNALYVLDPSRTMEVSGNITKWQFYTKNIGTVELLVLRLAGKRGKKSDYRIIGLSRYRVTSRGYHEKKLRSQFPVERGDVLGIYFPSRSMIPFDGKDCTSRTSQHATLYRKYLRRSMVGKGGLVSMTQKPSNWKACRTYSVRAFINATQAT